MSGEKDVKWSMAVNSLIADWMMFVNAYKRQEARLRTIQVIISPFGRTEKVFYSEEPMLHDAYDTWYKSYFGKMQEIDKAFGFDVKNESNIIITVDMSSIDELMKVKLGDHEYQSAREVYGNEFDTLKKYVLDYKTHKESWEDVTPQEWSEIEKELRSAYNQLSVDLSNRLSEYTKVVNEIMILCDNAFDNCRDYMRSAYEEYYVGVQRLASELQGIIGHSFSLNLWSEEIDLDNFDVFFNHYVRREMSLDDITTASRVLKRLIRNKGEI